ncbi:MAG: hypothetical protein ACLGXA_14375 [Acidobacteriota bacterium]
MFAAGLAASNLLTSTLSQTVAGFAGRASSTIKGFDSDLDSGNLSGAQSFLSALQQKATAQGAAPAGSAISTQFAQVGQDLQAGNAAAARSDFSTLTSSLAHLHHAGKAGSSNLVPASTASTDPSSPAALQSLNLLQQSAYNSALQATLPPNLPSFSVSSW